MFNKLQDHSSHLLSSVATAPHDAAHIRLIAGRNSPDYSCNISDPRKDNPATGRVVLSIWNQRVTESQGEHDERRLMVLIRNMEAKKFVLFEDDNACFLADNDTWTVNKRGNCEGREIATGRHWFVWQPHGSPCTVIRTGPGSARRFAMNRAVPKSARETIWKSISWDDA